MNSRLVAAAVGVVVAGLAAPAARAAEKTTANPQACNVLSERDKEVLTRLPRENILAVDKLLEVQGTGEPLTQEKPVLRGVTIAVRPVEGLTRERLQHLVSCGIARAASADPSQPTDWPRTPPGTVPYVHSGGDRFVVDLRTRDEAAADAMWKSAQALKPR